MRVFGLGNRSCKSFGTVDYLETAPGRPLLRTGCSLSSKLRILVVKGTDYVRPTRLSRYWYVLRTIGTGAQSGGSPFSTPLYIFRDTSHFLASSPHQPPIGRAAYARDEATPRSGDISSHSFPHARDPKIWRYFQPCIPTRERPAGVGPDLVAFS